MSTVAASASTQLPRISHDDLMMLVTQAVMLCYEYPDDDNMVRDNLGIRGDVDPWIPIAIKRANEMIQEAEQWAKTELKKAV